MIPPAPPQLRGLSKQKKGSTQMEMLAHEHFMHWEGPGHLRVRRHLLLLPLRLRHLPKELRHVPRVNN